MTAVQVTDPGAAVPLGARHDLWSLPPRRHLMAAGAYRRARAKAFRIWNRRAARVWRRGAARLPSCAKLDRSLINLVMPLKLMSAARAGATEMNPAATASAPKLRRIGEPPAARWTAPCRQRCGSVAKCAKLESLHLSGKHLLVNFFLKRAKNFLLKLKAGLGNRQFVIL